jgi:hypothetical protein
VEDFGDGKVVCKMDGLDKKEMKSTKNIFVFVVCGGIEHIDTLHYSLEALKKFSKNEIYILTDAKRNEKQIIHDKILDISTPKYLNHHQASIFLKTGINKFLPKGNLYCYLDTDVVALSEMVDEIFNEYQLPITFGLDHCKMNKFSPSAINCNCKKQFENWEKELKSLFKKFKHLEREEEDLMLKPRLEQKLEDIKKDKLTYKIISLKFWLSPFFFNLDGEFFLDKRNKRWVNKAGKVVLYEEEDSAITMIEKFSEYRCDIEKNHLWTIDGKNVFDAKCNHLQTFINTKFDLKIENEEWHHWNGGVFLFDDQSHDFLNKWHENTLEIFKDPEWKTRDQGTLIATVFQFGLEMHKTLSSKFNYIADFEHDKIFYHENLKFSNEIDSKIVVPEFIHVYHHWGDDNWQVWKDVEQKTGLFLDKERNIFNGLWIGNELSKLELLTINSFLENGHQFRLWVYDEIITNLPKEVLIADANEIIPKSNVFSYKNKNSFGHGKGSYAGFSDIFRYKLLYERGGWWVDMDITCLKEIYTDKPYFFREHHQLSVVGNILKAPKRSELMKLCYEEAVGNVDENNTDWHKPIEILNSNIEKLGLNAYINKNISNRDMWDETSKYIWSEIEVPNDWLFIHWQNEEWRTKNVNKKNIFYGSTLAKLLEKHHLLQIPINDFDIIKNKIEHHSLTRKLLSLTTK